MSEQTESERRFERYLAENEFEFERLDDGPSELRIPDYLIKRAGLQAICEVKEFSTSPLERRIRGGQTVVTMRQTEVHKPIREKIKDASAQLKLYKDEGLPLVVVLANPQRIAVDLSPDALAMAMYGDATFSIKVDTESGETLDKGGIHYGRDGRLTSNHRYISAVAVLVPWREDSSEPLEDDRPEDLLPETPIAYMYMEVVQTRNGIRGGPATPLPEGFFAGRRDRVYSIESGTLDKIREGPDWTISQ